MYTYNYVHVCITQHPSVYSDVRPLALPQLSLPFRGGWSLYSRTGRRTPKHISCLVCMRSSAGPWTGNKRKLGFQSGNMINIRTYDTKRAYVSHCWFPYVVGFIYVDGFILFLFGFPLLFYLIILQKSGQNPYVHPPGLSRAPSGQMYAKHICSQV